MVAGLFRSMGLERLLRDIHGAQFHPLQAKRQHRFTGRVGPRPRSGRVGPGRPREVLLPGRPGDGAHRATRDGHLLLLRHQQPGAGEVEVVRAVRGHGLPLGEASAAWRASTLSNQSSAIPSQSENPGRPAGHPGWAQLTTTRRRPGRRTTRGRWVSST